MGALASLLRTLNDCSTEQDQLQALRTHYEKEADRWNMSLQAIGIRVESARTSLLETRTTVPITGKRKRPRSIQTGKEIEQQRIQQWLKNPKAFWKEEACQLSQNGHDLSMLYAYSQKVDENAFEGVVRLRLIMMVFRELLDVFAPSSSQSQGKLIVQARIDTLADLIIKDKANTEENYRTKANLRLRINKGNRWRAVGGKCGNGIVFLLSEQDGQWVQTRMPLKSEALELGIKHFPSASEQLNDLSDAIRRSLLRPFCDDHRFQNFGLSFQEELLSSDDVAANASKRTRLEKVVNTEMEGCSANSTSVHDSRIASDSSSELSPSIRATLGSTSLNDLQFQVVLASNTISSQIPIPSASSQDDHRANHLLCTANTRYSTINQDWDQVLPEEFSGNHLNQLNKYSTINQDWIQVLPEDSSIQFSGNNFVNQVDRHSTTNQDWDQVLPENLSIQFPRDPYVDRSQTDLYIDRVNFDFENGVLPQLQQGSTKFLPAVH